MLSFQRTSTVFKAISQNFFSYFCLYLHSVKTEEGPIQVEAAYNSKQTWVIYRNLTNIKRMRPASVTVSS